MPGLGFIAGLVLQALGMLQALLSIVNKGAKETREFFIQDLTKGSNDILNSGIYGAIATHNAIVALQADVTTLVGRTGPVTLPTNPPAGYGGATEDQVFQAVWNTETDYDFGGGTFGSHFVDMHHVSINTMKNTLFTPWPNALFWMYGPWDQPGNAIPTDEPPVDPSSIIETDSVVVWLRRVAPTFTWFDDGTFGPFVYCISNQNGQFYYVFRISNGDWLWYKRQFFPTTAQGRQWPGADLVTLGEEVPLAPGVTLFSPCDGVIVNLAEVPLRFGAWTFDDALSYRNVGSLSFFTAENYQDLIQPLNFTSAIYTPRSIMRPAGVRIRTTPRVVGTVTPWTVTALT